jgi:NTE family protein
MSQADPTVAVVLAGGGARGAYEAGALSVLLPVLEERGLRPRIVLGTSVGALNASFLAANAHLPAHQVAADALAVWESISWTEVAQRLLSVGTLLRFSGYAGEVLGVPGARLDSLLDPAPLRTSLHDRVDFEQISRNVRAGDLDAVGVVATSAATNRSVVFHDGLASPPPDRLRGLDYVETPLSENRCWPRRPSRPSFPPCMWTRPGVPAAGTSTGAHASTPR